MHRNVFFLVLILISLCFASVLREKNYVIDNSDGNNCFITIILDTNRKTLPLEEIQSINPHRCQINYFYVITHEIDYSDSVVQNEAVIRYPYILRSTYQDDGYLPFVLSLLRSSNYTLIIKDEYFEERLPDGSWIDNAIGLLPTQGPSIVVSCAPEGTTQLSVAEGCMLMRSLELRMIIVNTEFRRKKIDPFFFFSEAFKCKFSSFINFFPYYSYKPKPSHLRTQYASLDSVRLKEACEETLGLEDVGCTNDRSRKRSASLVLSQYKRKYYMEQLEGIFSSNITIDEIVVFQNGIFCNYYPLFQRFPDISHIWATNWNSPFFLRHLIPLLFSSDYHIVLDDDIIPSSQTLKKLLDIIDKYDAPSGVGSRIITKSEYKKDNYQMTAGSVSSKNEAVPVDFVIQVYARTYLQSKVYWRYRPYTHRNGDDMHGSMTWFMECGRRPYYMEFYDNESFKNYGSDSVASYITKTHQKVRPQTYRSWVMAGFKGIMDKTLRDGYPEMLPVWEKNYLLQNHKIC